MKDFLQKNIERLEGMRYPNPPRDCEYCQVLLVLLDQEIEYYKSELDKIK